jgi:uncharacterized protein (TIGR02117 family)
MPLLQRGERALQRTAAVIGALIGVVAGLLLLTTRFADARLYPATGQSVNVFISDNGFHSDLVIPVRELAAAADALDAPRVRGVLAHFNGQEYVMLGWGDLQFYTGPATVDLQQFGVGVLAALGLNGAGAVHVAGLTGDPRLRLAGHRMVRLRLSRQGVSRLAMRLEKTVSGSKPLRAGVYGDVSAFFPSDRRFHLFNLCNHWTAELLDAAGVPTHALLSGAPDALVGDLVWRAGGEIMPPPDPAPAP